MSKSIFDRTDYAARAKNLPAKTNSKVLTSGSSTANRSAKLSASEISAHASTLGKRGGRPRKTKLISTPGYGR